MLNITELLPSHSRAILLELSSDKPIDKCCLIRLLQFESTKEFGRDCQIAVLGSVLCLGRFLGSYQCYGFRTYATFSLRFAIGRIENC